MPYNAPLPEPSDADRLWQQMVDGLKGEKHLTTASICGVFRKWGRHLFVEPKNEFDRLRVAGDNDSFEIEHGQMISQPQMVAQMTEWLEPKPGETALKIGLGSGWQAALLQELVGERGKVFAIERIEGLVQLARNRFDRLELSHIQIVYGDGMSSDDVPVGPFDMITCAAGCVDAPQFWKDRLQDGGRLIYPKQAATIENGQTLWRNGEKTKAPDGWEDGPLHALCKTTRSGDVFQEVFAEGFCRYVPLLPKTEQL
ncbi:MAG: protein-L-isoaspartate O-methyltransferase [Candidatus Peregrinibacteria bacterium Greene0416_62]|nr:MAG: protein-L-isoaspartate O-methyltransferase [Candidatus Peregrinibacteria bacterium Greene0416_62]TSC98838.1 MAG: protein-L-isoaspartate O-methyltransferase [Candidatus Peregrinibacteria bacterium Greene1014_49]